MEEVTIKNLKPPCKRDLEKDLEWFCNSLGLIRERDKEKTGFKIFKLIFESIKDGKGLTINEITEKIELSRTTIVHHLKSMEESGMIIEKNRVYELRRNSLHEMVDEIEKDLMNLLRIHTHQGQVAPKLGENLDVLRQQRPFQCFAHQHVWVDCRGLELADAHEIHQVGDDIVGRFNLAADNLEVLGDLGILLAQSRVEIVD